MAVSRLDYFYDGQIEAFLKQIVAAFHGFSHQTTTRDGSKVLKQIPVQWGDPSRMVTHIMRNGSENVVNSTPFITVYIAGMEHAPERRQDPAFVEHLKVVEREFNDETNTYTTNPGNYYSVERRMPVPYNMTVQVDIWTTNTPQKLQIFEQIGVLYNPDVWFQSNNNPLDWSALTTIIQNGISWSSRTVPVGTDNPIDIMTWTFIVPIWINPPAKVRRQSVIHQIITNIANHECFSVGTDFRYADTDLYAQIIVSPGNHQIRVDGDEITLLSSEGNEYNELGNILPWKPLLDQYGLFKDGETHLYLKRYTDDLDDYTHDVIGTLDFHPNKENVLLFTIIPNTLPANTLDPINAIIDPHIQYPGNGLPPSQTGQRYLLTRNTWTEEIGGQSAGEKSGLTEAWMGLVAKEHDIIEYNGATWAVAFNSTASSDVQFVVNSFTSKQLTFDGKEWTLAVDGEYNPGFWRLGIAGFDPGEIEPTA